MFSLGLNSIASKHTIGTRNAGLFSNFFAVLAHLDWCERNNRIPVVYWDSVSVYYKQGGYNGSHNVWEYYFEPISSAFYQVGDHIDRNYNAPDGTYLEHGHNFVQALTPEFRKRMNDLINKYIHVKESILKKIEEFYEQKMKNKKTIGFHIRRTDNYLSINVPMQKYIDVAMQYPDYLVLVCTDDQDALEIMKKALGSRVISYDVYRSRGNASIHHHSSYSKALAGEEVLIEVLLLAHCDIFVHAVSHVAGAALYFNPTMPNIFLEPWA